jgi:long-chain acyl-CoA synthetase
MMELGFWKIAQEDPSRLALVEPDGTEISAGELLARVNRLVHGLRAQGLERGGCVAVVLDNAAPILEVYLAATQAGWYMVPVNWHLTAGEMAYIISDSEAKAVIATPRVGDTVRQALDQLEFPAGARFATGAGIPGFRAYAELQRDQPAEVPSDRTAGASMTYTSGTTGHPKGIRRPLPPASPETVATQNALFLSLFGITPGSKGVHFVGAPLYHTAVLNFSTNHLHLGHTVVLVEKWEPEDMLQRIEKYKVTSSHMVPTQFVRLLKLPEEVRRKYDLSSLSHMVHGAAPCPIDVKKKMIEWWGPCVIEYYAASEGGGTLVTAQDWLKKPGTVGKPWPISEIRILDDAHQPVAAGTAGTVWIRMGTHKFEYHKDQKKTGDAWRDGFFTVGDAGYVDEDGYLFLCDRKADMIISGGVNIYPAEIEAVLLAHPQVADAAVFGIPDEDWGEQVKAVIQPIGGVTPGPELEAALRDFASGKLAKYKTPKTFDFIAEMPRDPNGKLYKRKLRDPYWKGRDRAI